MRGVARTPLRGGCRQARTGDWVRFAREELGLSREKLAVRAGVGVRTVARIEDGCDCRLATLGAIADALDTPIDDLIGQAS